MGETIGATRLEDTRWQDGFIINKQDDSQRIAFKDAVNKTKWASVSLTEYGWFVAAADPLG